MRLVEETGRRVGGDGETGSDADDPQMKDESLQREQHLRFRSLARTFIVQLN